MDTNLVSEFLSFPRIASAPIPILLGVYGRKINRSPRSASNRINPQWLQWGGGACFQFSWIFARLLALVSSAASEPRRNTECCTYITSYSRALVQNRGPHTSLLPPPKMYLRWRRRLRGESHAETLIKTTKRGCRRHSMLNNIRPRRPSTRLRPDHCCFKHCLPHWFPVRPLFCFVIGV